MKYFLPFLGLLLQAQALYSQQKAQFELPIYFEDARGNKDSVVVGYDRSIKIANSFNPEFGEDYLYTPFDSVLEVRAMSYPYNYTTKKLVEGVFEANDGTCDNYGAYLTIVAQAKYLPVKIYWDTTKLFGVCHRNTVLSRNKDLLLFQEPFGTPRLLWGNTWCMQYEKEIIDPPMEQNNIEQYYEIEWEVEGKTGMQKLPGFSFSMFFWPFNYCEDYVKTLSTESPAALPVAVWPNPVSGDLQVQWQETDGSPLLFRMYALNGTPVLEQTLHQNPGSFTLDGVSSGVYYLQAPGYETRRVVVMR
jgi:hypothetical protein